MQLALRRSYGYAFMPPLNRGLMGLGDDTTDTTDTTSGSLYSQLIAEGVDPTDAEAYLATGELPGGSTGPISSAPAGPATPTEQAAASAWLLQNIPPIPAGGTLANVLSTLALTSAQIATGLTAGTVKTAPAATCPSGYQYASGPCVPGAAASAPLIAGVSNTTLGIIAAVFIGLAVIGSKK